MVFTGNGVLRRILGSGVDFGPKRVFLRYFNAKLMGGVARVF